MILANAHENQPLAPTWKQAQAAAITDPAELIALLELDPAWLPAARAAAKGFPLRVPRGLVARMRKGDPHDPLLRQVLPIGAELDDVPGFGTDPVGESDASPVPGLLQKYHGRVLLPVTGACGIHCRYCFRRHFDYSAQNPRRHWQGLLEHLVRDAEVSEVILSGGDPLTLDTPRLTAIGQDLAAIPHIRRLRIHTRQAVVLPERIDDEFVAWIGALPFDVVMVVHVNHANEIDDIVRNRLARLRKAGVTLLNQSVLLRGVNDDADALVALSETLFSAGVLPYYLHLLDPVAGAAHFDVSENDALRLFGEIHARLPGYLVPRLVREIAARPGKTLIFP